MSTLAERVKRWGDELNQEWLAKGLEQGLEPERGLVRGLAARTRMSARLTGCHEESR
jgi:hypothetical protein